MSSLLQAAGPAAGVAVPFALRAGAVLLLGVSAVTIAVHALVLGAAAERTPAITRKAVPALVWAAALALWFAITVVVGDGAAFPIGGGLRERGALSLAVAAIPFAAAMALLVWSRTARTLNAAIRPEWLVWAQSYRVVGFVFLFPYLHYGIVDAGFAWPAAVGDMITGLLAPFIGLALARQRPGAVRWAIAWNVFGMIDLLVAPLGATLSGSPVFAIWPITIAALFAGPPLGMITHVYSLRNLIVREGAGRTAAAPAPAVAGAARARLVG